MKWMTPRSHVAVQHGHLPFIFPFSSSWLTSHLVCEIYQILLDIYLAYSWNIQVQVSDWIEYSRYMLSMTWSRHWPGLSQAPLWSGRPVQRWFAVYRTVPKAILSVMVHWCNGRCGSLSWRRTSLQYKLDIYPLDLYIWHMPDILLLRNFGVITLPHMYGIHITYTFIR